MKPRLNSKVLKLDKARQGLLRLGYYSDKYFVRTQDVLWADKQHPRVLMQLFTRKPAVVCGLDEAIAVLRLSMGRDFPKLKIHALHDGDEISPWETVMTIEGDYTLFAQYETVYLGIIARRTRVAPNTKRVVQAANGKPVLFFPARFDHWTNEAGDGYAAYISGALGSSTDANCAWWGSKGLGTVPHALIAAYGGDTVEAALKFDKYVDPDVNRIVLVDFDNDCIGTSVKVVEAFRKKVWDSQVKKAQFDFKVYPDEYIGRGQGKVWGVRFDTSNMLRDVSVTPHDERSTGVCPELVWKARAEFNSHGWNDLKIVVSGGFNEERIKLFERLAVPVDVYAVGSSLLSGSFDFTADIVKVDGKPCAKVGRKYNPNPRLEVVR